MDLGLVHKESPESKGKGKDKGKGKPKGKGKGKGKWKRKSTHTMTKERKRKSKSKHNDKGKSAGKGKLSQETFRGTCRSCGKTGHTWSGCWAKGGGAARRVNSVGERENG